MPVSGYVCGQSNSIVLEHVPRYLSSFTYYPCTFVIIQRPRKLPLKLLLLPIPTY